MRQAGAYHPILDDLDYADTLEYWRTTLKQLSESSEIDPDTARSIRRSINAITSQVGDEYAGAMSDKTADSLAVHQKIKSIEENMRKAVKPVRQTHAHHGGPLEAFGTAVQGRSGRDIQLIKKKLWERGYRLGGDAESMAPYSGGAHLGQDGWTDIAAHTDLIESAKQDKWVYAAKSPFAEQLPLDLTVDDFVDMYVDRIAEPQRMVNEAAWRTKDETAIRRQVLDQAESVGLKDNPFTTTNQQAITNSSRELGKLGVDVKQIRQQQRANGTIHLELVTPEPVVPTPKPVAAKPAPTATVTPKPGPNAYIPDTAARKAGHQSIAQRVAQPTVKPAVPEGNITKLKTKAPRGVKIPKGLAKAGAVVAGVLPIFDAADAVAGTVGAVDNTKSKGDRLASTFQAVSGTTGLASLNPAVAPVTAPISLATAGLSAATQRRADMDKPKPKPANYGQGTSGFQAQVKPITNHNRASLKPTPNMPKQKEKSPMEHLINEGSWALKQLGINL